MLVLLLILIMTFFYSVYGYINSIKERVYLSISLVYRDSRFFIVTFTNQISHRKIIRKNVSTKFVLNTLVLTII